MRKEGEVPKLSASALVDEAEVFVPLAGLIDVAVELPRLEKDLKKAHAEVETVGKKLDNPNFAQRAPAEVVEETKQRLEDGKARVVKLGQMIERLKKA